VQVQIGHARLRHRRQPEFVGLLTEISWHQRIDDIALDAFGKALLNDRGGGVAGAEAGDAGQLLVLLDQGLGFAGNIGRRDLHLDLPFGATAGFSGAHVYLSVCPPAVSGARAQSGPAPKPPAYILECKDRGRAASNAGGYFSLPFWDFSNYDWLVWFPRIWDEAQRLMPGFDYCGALAAGPKAASARTIDPPIALKIAIKR
jgi:hypothetical protein